MEPTTGTKLALVEGLSWVPCTYVGSYALEGITISESGHIPGQYAQAGNLFLFQPEGSTKVFEVSDEDITRVPVLSAA